MALIIHLVPHLPPEICGVGDYANLVGGKIEELHPGVRCGYVACGHRRSADVAESAMRRDVTRDCSRDTLWQAIAGLADGRFAETVAIVLHYSGYGYSANGAPTWLAEAMEHRPAEWSSCRVVTFFHELFATGRPWERTFWISGRQQAVARRIARASDALVTNRGQSARWLEEVVGRPTGNVPHLAVPSNVGEPQDVPCVDSRTRRAIAFGNTASKRFALYEEASNAARFLQQLQVDELVDVGEECDLRESVFTSVGVRVSRLGRLPAEDISQLLLDSAIGFVRYNPRYSEKSGVLAAYMAHGVVPVMPGVDENDLNRNQYLFLSSNAPHSLGDLRRVSTDMLACYGARSSCRHAAMLVQITQLVKEISASPPLDVTPCRRV